jgi:hypothetical protein
MAMPDYLNFELQILEQRGDLYKVVVLDAPQGLPPDPIAHFFRMPYDEHSLQRVLAILSGERQSRGISKQEVARQFGETMFELVFAHWVYQLYQEAHQLALQEKKWLRVRLNTSRAGELANLPWEFLREPNQDFLALSKSTALVRYPRKLVTTNPRKTERPLRILVMISAPEGLPKVDEAAERLHLERATIRLQKRGLVEITYLEDASLRCLQRTLRQQEFHVFHYIGHGGYDPNTGTGFLMLEDPYNHIQPDPVRGEALARELHEEDTLRLVVLNSCQGAQADSRDPFSGVASSLVQRGIPAVVGQQYEISDKAAVFFSEEFYRAVAEGYPLEAALAEGRRAIISMMPDSLEWATPVLFLQEQDSQGIFGFPPPDAPRSLWERLTTPERLPRTMVVVMSLILLAGMFFLAGFFSDGERSLARIFPSTATPVPDVELVISDVRFSPRNPQPGELVAVFVDITNQGQDASPAFAYEWQGSIFDPATTLTQRVEGLAAGGVLHDHLTFRYGWWGAYIAETRLDTGGEIIEPSEQNSRPVPLRTDNTLPLVLDFSEALPNGDFVRRNEPVPFGIFEQWGIHFEAVHPDPACRAIVPWFKFVGVSQIAMTTGLPTNPDQCSDGSIIVTFVERRIDSNPSGVSSIQADFVPGTGRRTLQAFRDSAGLQSLRAIGGLNNRRDGLTLTADAASLGFVRVYRLQLDSEKGVPLNLARLRLTAP